VDIGVELLSSRKRILTIMPIHIRALFFKNVDF
jgi:hypothetical protein